MAHVFQVEWWGKHPSEHHFQLFMVKEIGEVIGKGKMTIIGILFMK